VVATTIRTFQASGLEYARIDTMADSLLMQALAGERVQEKSARCQELSQRFPAMVVELKKKGMTLQLLWELYIQEYPGGYQYCLNFHRWRKSPDVVMHIEHKAGEEMFVDWAGDKLEVINGNTGEAWALEQFVAILGASELTYVEARESQGEEDWIRANEGALWYWGGSSTAVIPDYVARNIIRGDKLRGPAVIRQHQHHAAHETPLILAEDELHVGEPAVGQNPAERLYDSSHPTGRIAKGSDFSVIQLRLQPRGQLDADHPSPLGPTQTLLPGKPLEGRVAHRQFVLRADHQKRGLWLQRFPGSVDQFPKLINVSQ
jgi:hypothetical protein